MNFKVGNKVKVTSFGHSFTTYFDWFRLFFPGLLHKYSDGETPPNGTTGTIVAIRKHERQDVVLYAIESGEKLYLMGEPGIELVEEDMFCKDDLKTGMFVTTRNGKWFRLLLGTENGDYGFNQSNGSYIKLKCYNDDLTDKNSREWDIVRVDSVKYPENIKRKLLWERKPEITELTLAQIADKFNIPIETLRVKK